MSDDGPARTAAFSYRITCSKHEDDQQTTCFTADAVILDAAGREVAVLPGKRMHAYSEAAEDEAGGTGDTGDQAATGIAQLKPWETIRHVRGGILDDLRHRGCLFTGQCDPLASLSILMASSIVKLFGCCTGGNSLKEVANLSASAYAPKRM